MESYYWLRLADSLVPIMEDLASFDDLDIKEIYYNLSKSFDSLMVLYREEQVRELEDDLPF